MAFRCRYEQIIAPQQLVVAVAVAVVVRVRVVVRCVPYAHALLVSLTQSPALVREHRERTIVSAAVCVCPCPLCVRAHACVLRACACVCVQLYNWLVCAFGVCANRCVTNRARYFG